MPAFHESIITVTANLTAPNSIRGTRLLVAAPGNPQTLWVWKSRPLEALVDSLLNWYEEMDASFWNRGYPDNRLRVVAEIKRI
jgi:hypothetical protein